MTEIFSQLIYSGIEHNSEYSFRVRLKEPIQCPTVIFLIGLTICYQSEMAGNPVIQEMGIDQSQGSMEGKEVRFGVPQSALFTTVTTSFTTGTVNNMHDTLTPL